MNPPRILPRRVFDLMKLILVLSFLAGLSSAVAHDPGLSTGELRLVNQHAEATLVFAVKDAGELANALSGLDEVWTPAACAAVLARHATNALEVMFDGRPMAVAHPTCTFDSAGNVTVGLRVQGVSRGTLRLRSTWLAHLPLGHRQFVTVQRVDGSKLGERLLSARDDTVTLEMAVAQTASSEATVVATTGGASSLDFLVLGVRHILIGYDHLLFLFSLLIVSRSALATLKVVTVFTVAHSITLALATFDAVRIPSSIVEPLIAASIVFVALENLLRREIPSGRLWLVFGFGLVHGLGFASVLRELGVGANGGSVVLPLVSFNFGVELGQLLVALPLVALLAGAARHPVFERRWVPACSLLAAFAGGFWLLERLLA